jgi:hypothetical protein
VRDRPSSGSPGPFQVFVSDNDRYFFDDGASSPGPSFRRYEDALDWCRRRVEASVEECWEPGLNAAQLFARYKGFGDDPWVLPVPEGAPHFSAWEHAEQVARRLCAERGAAPLSPPARA